eukprot:389444-Prymnesium_polylepis.2
MALSSDDEPWAPPDLIAFLKEASLPQLVGVLVKHGFDDVADFADWDAHSFVDLRAALESERVPAGHISKLERKIRALASPPAVESTPTPIPATVNQVQQPRTAVNQAQ